MVSILDSDAQINIVHAQYIFDSLYLYTQVDNECMFDLPII